VAIVELAHSEQGPVDAPPVLLAPSLGATLAMWDESAEALADAYRVVRFDTRGHGASPVPPGPYTLSELAGDVVALADSLGIDRFALVGLSLGGAIAQTAALEHPGRLRALVLCCTGPVFGEPQTWRQRAAQVRAEGTGFLVDSTMERWFTPSFRASRPAAVARMADMIASTVPEGYAACCDALSAYDVTDRLAEIAAPTRVVSGAQDPGSPPEVGRAMAERIPAADFVVLEDAAHIANVAQPEPFNAAVREHLDRHARAPAAQ
jgi:3-oxoadipate enol-lactonase